MAKDQTYGPFSAYTEVLTDHGTFGVPANKVMSFDTNDDGGVKAVFSDPPKPKKSVAPVPEKK